MRRLPSILIILSSLILTACDDPKTTPGGLEGFNPRLCTSKSSNGCGVDWHLIFKKSSFPPNAQILFNETIIIDQCDPQPYWEVSGETSKEIEIKISDYINLNGTEKLSIRIYGRQDNCYTARFEKSYAETQDYSIKHVGGKKQIWVEH